MYLYHDVQTSESLVVAQDQLAQENTTAQTSHSPAQNHPARTRTNRSVLQASGPRRGSKHLQDPGLATKQAAPPPKICQAQGIADGWQKPAHGHTRVDPPSLPKGWSIPVGAHPRLSARSR